AEDAERLRVIRDVEDEHHLRLLVREPRPRLEPDALGVAEPARHARKRGERAPGVGDRVPAEPDLVEIERHDATRASYAACRVWQCPRRTTRLAAHFAGWTMQSDSSAINPPSVVTYATCPESPGSRGARLGRP